MATSAAVCTELSGEGAVEVGPWAGESVLVLGASGGCGSAAVQIAKEMPA